MVTKVKTECCYAEKCTDEGESECKTCVNNEKRSYYKYYDPTPWYPYIPLWGWDKPYYGTTTADTAYDTSMIIYSHYQLG